MFGEYVPVAEKRARAQKRMKELRGRKKAPAPIAAFSGGIATSFWGKSWCANLEKYASLSNRLERGRAYLRAGCVCDLACGAGTIRARVSGSRLYRVEIKIAPMRPKLWEALCRKCSRNMGGMLELLRGGVSKEIMALVCDPRTGLFPSLAEIDFACSCPDYAHMCKHVSAALYGIGRLLDERPELLFELRQVDPAELLSRGFVPPVPAEGLELDIGALENIFDIELDMPAAARQDAQAAKKEAPVPAPVQKIAPIHSARPSGADIKKLRKLAGLPQWDMAARTGVGLQTIRKWEESKRPVLKSRSLEKLLKIQDEILQNMPQELPCPDM